KIKLEGAKITDLGLNKTAAKLYVKISNPSAISFQVTDQQYDAYLNGSFVSHIQKIAPETIVAHGDTVVDLLITFNPLKALGNIFTALSASKLNGIRIKLKGYVDLQKAAFTHRQQVEVEDTLGNLLASMVEGE
ncbi:MAG TPA: LEA type 2 family protein, partial [Flavobacterium sp.]|nr:LEA type 2 family protein [Flavobacterium sp.]